MSKSKHPYTRDEAYQKFRENPEEFFDKVWHKEAETDGDLLNREWPAYWTRYHYNLVENGILEVLHERELAAHSNLQVLDVGCGTGHWIEFYLKTLAAKQVVGVDFSQIAVDRLTKMFTENVKVCRWDVTQQIPDGIESSSFDVINAIGILFHVVDDQNWQTAPVSYTHLTLPTTPYV